MVTKEIKIEGMSCGHCVKAVNIELSKLNLESFDVKIGTVKVTFDSSKINLETVFKTIENTGYKIRKD